MADAKKELLTFNDLEHWLNERRVTEVECLVPDLTGVARGKILPREKFTEDRGMRIPEAVVAMGVTGELPSQGPYYDVVNPTDRDMQLRPDASTVRIVPWASDPTAQVIHDCYDREGKLVEKYALRKTEDAGCTGGDGGEYPLQDGFGWTNGVVRRWLAE